VPLFDQLGEKALSDFMPEYLVVVLGKFNTDKKDPDHTASTHLPSTPGGGRRGADKNGYLGYHSA
jgi:hypothetical protein